MKFTAIDLELDQPSSDIIQIGAVALDTNNMFREFKFSAYVDIGRPINYGHILSNGESLRELLPDYFETAHVRESKEVTLCLNEFALWLASTDSGKTLVQWGKNDTNMLIENCNKYGLEFPKNIKVIDLKVIYQTFIRSAHRLGKKSGLVEAATNYAGGFYGAPHDAVWDAYNTGRIGMRLFKDLNTISLIKNNLDVS